MDKNKEPLCNQNTAYIIKSLEEIRDKLIEVNTLNGNLARFQAMKKEITENGWAYICSKYHPDINTGDPAAFELFALYKFVYETAVTVNR